MNEKQKKTIVTIKTVIGLIVIAILIAMIIWVGRFAVSVMNIYVGDIETVRDPQFAEEAEAPVTMPPELYEEESISRAEDRSATWDIPAHTPVDKTAQELAGEETETGE